MESEPGPKRGDLIQTNVGKPRERTWLVLSSRHMKRAKHPRRFKVWMGRWWELEPEMRLRLYHSAERNGGQRVLHVWRYPAKKQKPRGPFEMSQRRRKKSHPE
jgi:hypothetical protein